MASENPRILELRRRVQADPASIAFAQLAEECRRGGAYDEAVGLCRTGLARHPDYLSARVTLGRALVELGSLDEARHELDLVVAKAPDNLPAIRTLAEIHQRKGDMPRALEFYRRALMLAKHDPELEDAVGRLASAVEPEPPPVVQPPAAGSVEALFDFDRLLEQLGETVHDTPRVAEIPPVPAASVVQPPQRRAEAPPAPPADEGDRLGEIELELRAFEERRARDEAAAREAAVRQRRLAVLHDLEAWLSAIVADRARPSAS